MRDKRARAAIALHARFGRISIAPTEDRNMPAFAGRSGTLPHGARDAWCSSWVSHKALHENLGGARC